MKKLCILFTALLLMCLVGCDSGTSDNTSTTTVTSSGNEESEIGFYKTDEDTFEVKTKYCSLYYPKKWEKYIKTEIDEKEPYSVKFIALEDNKDIPLFDVVFGKQSIGSKLGKLEIDNEKVDVYLVDHSGEWPENITKDSESNLFAMSEDVNVLISKLVYNSNLVLEN